MPFVPFRNRFRDLADRETRTITRLQESAPGLPAGQYAFVEMYCDEPGCDCRRVLFTVMDTTSGNCEAVINFGWEDESFYAAWLHDDDPYMLAELRGPALHLGPAQGRHANAILELAKQLVLSDRAYVARVKRHYAMFREDVEQGSRIVPDRRNTKIGRNDPCPCGSGRKHKKCCAGKARDAGTPTQAEVLAQSEIRITQEIDHIVGRAMEGSGSVVRLGQLVLFSTASGDAWLLDPEQGTALPLARAGERLPARVLETDERFVIEWTHDYQVHGQWFDAVERASGAREVFTGYPTAQLVVD